MNDESWSRQNHQDRRDATGQAIIRSIARNMLRLALRLSDGVILQNPDDQQDLLDSGLLSDPAKSIVVNGSGVDLEKFTSQPLPHGAPSFLLISRLLVAKGVREYAEAARLIRTESPDAQFHLVGWFDDRSASVGRAEVAAWQRERVLEYHGAVDDVRPWIARCHVFVLPSYYREGTPRTALEAMATGRAIITTDLPGCRQTVTDGDNGYLVPARDSLALAAAMKKFIDDPGLAAAMGARSRELAERKYDVRSVSKMMLRYMGLD